MLSDLAPPDRAPSLRRLISVLSAAQIASKAKSMIRESVKEQMRDGHRLAELCLVQWLADGSVMELGHALVSDHRIYEDVFDVVKMLLGGNDKGDKKVDTVNWEIVDMAGAVLLYVLILILHLSSSTWDNPTISLALLRRSHHPSPPVQSVA